MKHWTKQETTDLRRLYNQLPNEQLVEYFNRTYLSIYKKARAIGLYKTAEMKFTNQSNSRKREKSSNWKGGRKKTQEGYILILLPEHQRADTNGYIMEHIAVWERANKTKLPDGYCIHHVNGKKGDNRPENLEAMPHGEHTTMHHTGMKRSKSTKENISKAKREYHKKIGHEGHPSYKPIDPNFLLSERKSGKTVKQICKDAGINKTTYYKKLKRSGLF